MGHINRMRGILPEGREMTVSLSTGDMEQEGFICLWMEFPEGNYTTSRTIVLDASRIDMLIAALSAARVKMGVDESEWAYSDCEMVGAVDMIHMPCARSYHFNSQADCTNRGPAVRQNHSC